MQYAYLANAIDQSACRIKKPSKKDLGKNWITFYRVNGYNVEYWYYGNWVPLQFLTVDEL